MHYIAFGWFWLWYVLQRQLVVFVLEVFLVSLYGD